MSFTITKNTKKPNLSNPIWTDCRDANILEFLNQVSTDDSFEEELKSIKNIANHLYHQLKQKGKITEMDITYELDTSMIADCFRHLFFNTDCCQSYQFGVDAIFPWNDKYPKELPECPELIRNTYSTFLYYVYGMAKLFCTKAVKEAMKGICEPQLRFLLDECANQLDIYGHRWSKE